LTGVKEAKAFWKPDVNKCLEIIKKANGWIIDWTKAQQRNYANMLVNKIKKTDLVLNWIYTRDTYLTDMLGIICKSKYDVRKINWPYNIFYNLASLQWVAKSMLVDEWEDESFIVID
jgi:hypothetical protein